MKAPDGLATPESLWDMAEAFVTWLDRAGYESYDPYDVWGTSFGLAARRLYYRASILGLPLIAPMVMLDVLFPSARSWLVGKARFATADAQLILAFLNLDRLRPHACYLDRAMALSDELLESSVPGYHGHCWGYPFDWQTGDLLWRRDTPFITATPYCFEAFLALHDRTGEARYLDVAESIARFVSDDLNDTDVSEHAAASSYSPTDRTMVINASAYRAYVLFEAAGRFDNPRYRRKAHRNLTFILESQRDDGSWLYALGNRAQAFIDHFHTCFVLKNLWKLNRHAKSDLVSAAVQRGYEYYRRELFDADGEPRSFAVRPRTQIVRLEMYNVAEAVSLGVLLRDEVPEALEVAVRLAGRLRSRYQLGDGHFVTRVYRGGFRHTFPFLRWPQAQLFYAVTNLLTAIADRDRPRQVHGLCAARPRS